MLPDAGAVHRSPGEQVYNSLLEMLLLLLSSPLENSYSVTVKEDGSSWAIGRGS